MKITQGNEVTSLSCQNWLSHPEETAGLKTINQKIVDMVSAQWGVDTEGVLFHLNVPIPTICEKMWAQPEGWNRDKLSKMYLRKKDWGLHQSAAILDDGGDA